MAHLAPSTVSDFVTASPTHKDLSFRFLQYLCKTIGTTVRGKEQLLAIAGAIDSARGFSRFFDVVGAVRDVESGWSVQKLAALASCPLEVWYYLNMHAPRLVPVPEHLGRLVGFLGGTWAALEALVSLRRLALLRRAQGARAASERVLRECEALRRKAIKLLLDALLNASWALGPLPGLGPRRLCALGMVSASLGLLVRRDDDAAAAEARSKE
jgi:hypothetical protein